MPDRSLLISTVLGNGLEVLLYPTFDAPVASFQVWYRVGSRNERPGLTGASHWVEHMMFKGTEKIAPGQLMLQVNQNGGEINAFTSFDYTAYHETMPADRIALSVHLEADRMTGLLMNPEQTSSERTVILSERQGSLNNPTYLLWEEVFGTAFRSHSYRHLIIGTEHDLKTMARDDLYNHYRRFYAPNNAVVVVTGAFDSDKMLAEIESAFGSIPAVPDIDRTTVSEPAQIGERRVTIHHPEPAPEVILAWHAPGGASADVFAFELLAGVLSGAGGRMGRSARLPRNLVASGKARRASASYLKGIDPLVFMAGATGLPDGSPAELEALLIEQIDLIKSGGVSQAELDRTRKLLTAVFHYGTESVSELANGLGEAAMFGDVDRFFSYPDDLRGVTTDDVQRVANEVLTERNRTVGALYPTASAGDDDVVPTLAALRCGIGGAGAPRLKPFERHEIEPGLVLLGQAQPADPVVVVSLRVEAGSADDPAGKHGLANLAGSLTMRGSGDTDRAQFEDACDELGASIGVSVGREYTDFNITCLAEDLEPSLDLLAQAWSRPTYSPDEVGLAKREANAALKQAEDSTASVADQTLREFFFPENHPLRHRVIGDSRDLPSIQSDDLCAFHAAMHSSRPITVAVVGGVSDLDRVTESIGRRFGGRTDIAGRSTLALATVPGGSATVTRELAGKEQADLALGVTAPAFGSPGWYDLVVADAVLGQFGMMGRIGDSVRQEQGLAYYAYSGIGSRKDRSIWSARAGVDPANIDLAIESILSVVRNAIDRGLTQDEVTGTIQFLTGRLALGMETNAGIAQILQRIEEYDLGLDYVERYPALVGTVTVDSARAALADSIDITRAQTAIARPA
jgi:zinc protease